MAYSWTPLTTTIGPSTSTHIPDHTQIHQFLNQHIATQFGQFDLTNVNVSGTYAIPSDWPALHLTMLANTTFTFAAPAKAGQTKIILFTGDYQPSFPSNVQWAGGAQPVYSDNSVYEFTTFDTGTNWYGSIVWESPQTPYDILVTPGIDEVINGNTLKSTIESSTSAGKIIAVKPGKYRIPSKIAVKSGQTIVGQVGAPGAEVIIDGSRVLTSWTNNSDNTWYASIGAFWPRATANQAICDISADAGTNLCYDRDRVWIDGLQGDIMADHTALLGTSSTRAYRLDRTNGRIYVKGDPATKTIEYDKVDTITDPNIAVNNVTWRNLVIQKFATLSQQGALNVVGNGNTVKDCTFRYNHGIGLFNYNASSTLVTNCYFYRNGQMGGGDFTAGSTYSNNIWEYCAFEENNTDDFYIGDWEAGGWKSSSNAGGILRHCTSVNDKGLSYWVDFGEQWIIEDNTSTNAWAQGIRIEVANNCIVRRNTITNSGHDMGQHYKTTHSFGWHGVFDTCAITISESQYVECYENNIFDPNNNGIVIIIRGNPTLTPSTLRQKAFHNFVHDNYIEQKQTPISINEGAGSNQGVYIAGGIGETGTDSTDLDTDYWYDETWTMPGGSGIAATKINQCSGNHYRLKTGDSGTLRFVFFHQTKPAANTNYKTTANYGLQNPADTTDVTYTA